MRRAERRERKTAVRGARNVARFVLVAGAGAAIPVSALAHDVVGQRPTAPRDLWQAWTLEPLVVLGVLGAACLYTLGVHRLWRSGGRESGVRSSQRWAFAAGLFALVVALVSPLDALGDALFSAHMAQHLILVLVAAPLLVLGNSLLPMLWSLPRGRRVALGRWWMRTPRMRSLVRSLTRPAVAWVLHMTALFFWHIPTPYGWALDHDLVHAFEHACFLGTAVLFWWVALEPVGRRRLGYGPAVLYVASAGALMGGLGAILTLARRPWYVGHIGRTAAWHLSPLADQQLAGVIMWVPAGFLYLTVAGVLFTAWLNAEEGTGGDVHGHSGARPGRLGLLRIPALGPGTQRSAVWRGAERPAGGARWLIALAVAVASATGALGACVDARGAPVHRVEGGDADRGAAAIDKYGCGTCHMIPGIGDANGMVGPPLIAFGRRTIIAGFIPNDPDGLVRWIRAPQGIVPGNTMPDLGVTEQDARDIAVYLYTLH